MNRHVSHRFGAPSWQRIAAFLIAALLVLPTALYTGCEGGSTGVENPGLAELPVDFRNEAGDMALAQGILEIYDRDHNPAVASEPLLRIEVVNQTGLRLTHQDFDRIGAARVLKNAAAASKRSASAGVGLTRSTELDSLIHFNLVFRSGSGSGAVATGLSYDPGRKVFDLNSVGAAWSVRLIPKPLQRFSARLHREVVHGNLGRVFLPGTPFQATLVDSDFVLQNLPQGRFGMRMLGGGGYVYAVRETLDTKAGHFFTAVPEPIGRVDSTLAPLGFGVDAGGQLNANMQEITPLQGQLLGADSNDSRLSIVWRVLRSLSTDSAWIAEPTRLNTQILFPTAGGFFVELAATLGATTVRDTVQYKSVLVISPAPAKLVSPQPGDSLRQGQGYKVTVSTSLTGLARLEYAYKDGAEGTWVIAVDSVVIAPGANPTLWTPPVLGKDALPYLLRYRMIPSDSLLVQISGPFFLIP